MIVEVCALIDRARRIGLLKVVDCIAVRCDREENLILVRALREEERIVSCAVFDSGSSSTDSPLVNTVC